MFPQVFQNLVVTRFQSIAPDKVGGGLSIKTATDLKIEITIMTTSDDIFEKWQLFVEQHSSGGTINPETCVPYKEAKTRRPGGNHTLSREFFKRLGPMTDDDLDTFAKHLLHMTPGWKHPWPKCSTLPSRIVRAGHFLASDWIERKKRKKVIVEDLDSLLAEVEFHYSDGTVIKGNWRAWKRRHSFTSGTYNAIMALPPNDYYRARLMNEAKKRPVTEVNAEKYGRAILMYNKFVAHKRELPTCRGHIRLRSQDFVSMVYTTQSNSQPLGVRMALGILDLRNVPGARPTLKREPEPPFLPFLNSLRNLSSPKVSDPAVWIWICRDEVDACRCTRWIDANMRLYKTKRSVYKSAKQEKLYDAGVRNPPVVYLIFLYKVGNERAEHAVENILPEYTPIDLDYYTGSAQKQYTGVKYYEAQWAIHNTELRMEFYIDMYNYFTEPGDNVFGLHTGTKAMLAAKVHFISFIVL